MEKMMTPAATRAHEIALCKMALDGCANYNPAADEDCEFRLVVEEALTSSVASCTAPDVTARAVAAAYRIGSVWGGMAAAAAKRGTETRARLAANLRKYRARKAA